MEKSIFDSLQKLSSFPPIKMDVFYLWIWYADKVPPHIGCSFNQDYFSLKVNGLELEVDVDNAKKLVEYKEIPFLLIETKIVVRKSEIITVFKSCKDSIKKNGSCLTPLLKLVNPPEKVRILVELLDFLSQREEINHIFGLNLSENYQGLPKYGIEEIKNRINQLQHC